MSPQRAGVALSPPMTHPAPTIAVACHAALPASGDATDWVQLLPAGTFRGADGRGPYRVPDAEALIAASLADGPLVIDEAHATDLAAPKGGAAPAQGWIVALEARQDGIWGRVEWTPLGQRALQDRLYRGISPVFAQRKDGTVLRLLRAALTNAPNLPLATLHSEQGNSMDLLMRLRQALGLGEDAEEEAVLTALEGRMAGMKAMHAQLAGKLGLAEDAEGDAIVTALQSRLEAATDATTLRGELVALQAQVKTLEGEKARDKATLAVDDAIKAGKPIPKTLRDHYIARHMQDPKAVELELGALPSLHAGGLDPKQQEGAAVDLQDATVIAAHAQELQRKEAAAGRNISIAEAVQRVTATRGAA